MNTVNHTDFKELKKCVSLSAPSLSRALNKLSRLDYVRRASSQDDERKRIVHITDEGRKFVKELML